MNDDFESRIIINDESLKFSPLQLFHDTLKRYLIFKSEYVAVFVTTKLSSSYESLINSDELNFHSSALSLSDSSPPVLAIGSDKLLRMEPESIISSISNAKVIVCNEDSFSNLTSQGFLRLSKIDLVTIDFTSADSDFCRNLNCFFQKGSDVTKWHIFMKMPSTSSEIHSFKALLSFFKVKVSYGSNRELFGSSLSSIVRFVNLNNLSVDDDGFFDLLLTYMERMFKKKSFQRGMIKVNGVSQMKQILMSKSFSEYLRKRITFHWSSENKSLIPDFCVILSFPIEEELLAEMISFRTQIICLSASDDLLLKMRLRAVTSRSAFDWVFCSPKFIDASSFPSSNDNDDSNYICMENAETNAFLTVQDAKNLLFKFLKRYNREEERIYVNEPSGYSCTLNIKGKHANAPLSVKSFTSDVKSSRSLALNECIVAAVEQLIIDGIVDKRFSLISTIAAPAKKKDMSECLKRSISFNGITGNLGLKVPLSFNASCYPWRLLASDNYNLREVFTLSALVIKGGNESEFGLAVAVPGPVFPYSCPAERSFCVSKSDTLGQQLIVNGIIVNRSEMELIIKFQVQAFSIFRSLFSERTESNAESSNFDLLCNLETKIPLDQRFQYLLLPMKNGELVKDDSRFSMPRLQESAVENWIIDKTAISISIEDIFKECGVYFAKIKSSCESYPLAVESINEISKRMVVFPKINEYPFKALKISSLEFDEASSVARIHCEDNLNQLISGPPEEFLFHQGLNVDFINALVEVPKYLQECRRNLFACEALQIFKMPKHCAFVSNVGKALTSKKSEFNDFKNLEVMEFFGDSMLKFYSTIEVFFRFSLQGPARMTEARKKIVQNETLSKIGELLKPIYIQSHYSEDLCHPPFLVDIVKRWTSDEWRSEFPIPAESAFENVHISPLIKDREKANSTHFYKESDKPYADCVEGLICAFFGMNIAEYRSFDSKVNDKWVVLFLVRIGVISLETARQLLPPMEFRTIQPHLERGKEMESVDKKFAGDDADEDVESINVCNQMRRIEFDFMSNYSQHLKILKRYNSALEAEDLAIDFDEIEANLGYKFKNRGWLLSAFLHTSMGNVLDPNLFRQSTFCDYNTLEFLGDGLLDWAVCRFLYFKAQEQYERMHEKWNDSDTLNIECEDDADEFVFPLNRLTAFSHAKNSLTGNTLLSIASVRLQLHKAVRFIGSEEGRDRLAEFVQWVEDHPNREWAYDFVQAPKLIGDLFESVLGAILVDLDFKIADWFEVIYPVLRECLFKGFGKAGTTNRDRPDFAFQNLIRKFDLEEQILIQFEKVTLIDVEESSLEREGDEKTGFLCRIHLINSVGKTELSSHASVSKVSASLLARKKALPVLQDILRRMEKQVEV